MNDLSSLRVKLKVLGLLLADSALTVGFLANKNIFGQT